MPRSAPTSAPPTLLPSNFGRPALRKTLAVLLLNVVLSPVFAAEFVAPYVQTVADDVELILDLADVGPDDYLIDLGSGDGRFVIAAGKRGAMAHGVELNSELIDLARDNAVKAGVAEKVAFAHGDIFEANISAASVVTLYLFPEANIQLRPKLLSELRPGTRVVSNSFHMGDWEPDARVQGRTSGGALLWIIPADVSGNWQMTASALSSTFTLAQRYQKVTTEHAGDNTSLVLTSARLNGPKIWLQGHFDGISYDFQGQVDGDLMTGVAHGRRNKETQVITWEARRIQ